MVLRSFYLGREVQGPPFSLLEPSCPGPAVWAWAPLLARVPFPLFLPCPCKMVLRSFYMGRTSSVGFFDGSGSDEAELRLFLGRPSTSRCASGGSWRPLPPHHPAVRQSSFLPLLLLIKERFQLTSPRIGAFHFLRRQLFPCARVPPGFLLSAARREAAVAVEGQQRETNE